MHPLFFFILPTRYYFLPLNQFWRRLTNRQILWASYCWVSYYLLWLLFLLWNVYALLLLVWGNHCDRVICIRLAGAGHGRHLGIRGPETAAATMLIYLRTWISPGRVLPAGTSKGRGGHTALEGRAIYWAPRTNPLTMCRRRYEARTRSLHRTLTYTHTHENDPGECSRQGARAKGRAGREEAREKGECASAITGRSANTVTWSRERVQRREGPRDERARARCEREHGRWRMSTRTGVRTG